MKIKFIILGCGSSLGVPRADGSWGKCNPKEKKNYRTRCSALIKTTSKNILIDTSPDLRYQLIKNNITDLLEKVGLNSAMANRYPHEFSGGQRQRIAIARSLIVKPKLIILDEAVSALDVSIRAQILDLLVELSENFGLSYLFISHDLSLVQSITTKVLVMKSGEIVEAGETVDVFKFPKHEYTKTLLDSSPNLQKALKKL